MSRVFLLISDPLVAKRMRATIDGAHGLKTVGWATTLEQARSQLRGLDADVVLADLQLADGWVADFVEELATTGRYGWPKTLLATLSLDDSQLLQALSRGADGYFVQGQSGHMLVATIEQVLAGGAEMAPAIARQVKAHFAASAWTVREPLDEDNPLHPDRIERQVLQWICDGFLPHEIARDLRISTREVAQRVRTLYRKLHLDRRTASLSLQLS